VIIDVTTGDWPAAKAELDEQIVPMVSGLPGFVGAYWIALAGGNATSVLVFDSEASAQALASQAESAPAGSVTTRRIELGEVIAHA
jgi:hypothetical protein